ncbi:hypothetical protein NIES73_40960 [Sphaerospermopsis kisseleviana NIES-73]|nr:hypothetical protein NIES73_40960 [Sphaerospermopsis kisseleviana NIES-73]
MLLSMYLGNLAQIFGFSSLFNDIMLSIIIQAR